LEIGILGLSLDINTLDTNSFLVTGTTFLWQRQFYCDINNFLVTGIMLLWQEQFSFDRNNVLVTGSIFLRQEESSYHRKYICLTLNIFEWQEIYLYDRKFTLVTGIIFFWQDTFFWHNFIWSLCLYHWIKTYFCGSSNKDFMWSLKISCQPGCQVDRDYPTLAWCTMMHCDALPHCD
jgi:hypothetical protein